MTLPKGWAEATIGEIADIRMEKLDPATLGAIPFIGLEHIEAQTSQLLGQGAASDVRSTVAGFRHGDILFGRLRPYLNKVIEASFDGCASAEIVPFVPCEGIASSLLKRIMMSEDFLAFTASLDRGDRPRVKGNEVAKYRFLLPPTAEQRRIVAKLDSLTARIARARAELGRVPVLAARLRQTSVSSAFAGWQRQRLGDLSISIIYGYTASARPHGPGSKFLRITDIQDGRVDWTSTPFVSPTSKDIERCRLLTGDIVFARSGATVGKSFLVMAPPEDAVFASYLIRVRVDERYLYPRAAAFYFQSDEYWKQIEAGATGTGQPNFNGSKLSDLMVPVSSLGEQQRAIASLQAIFARADRLEAEAARARALLDRLESAILTKAFRGELVPQDDSDEPASVLLERIRAERAASPRKKPVLRRVSSQN